MHLRQIDCNVTVYTERELDEAWVSDTTFIRTRQGWLYLAVIPVISLAGPCQIVMIQAGCTPFGKGVSLKMSIHSDQGSTSVITRQF